MPTDPDHDLLAKAKHALVRANSTRVAAALAKKAKSRLGQPEDVSRSPEASRAAWKEATSVAEHRAKAVSDLASSGTRPDKHGLKLPGTHQAESMLKLERTSGKPLRDTVELAAVKTQPQTHEGRAVSFVNKNNPPGREAGSGRELARVTRSQYGQSTAEIKPTKNLSVEGRQIRLEQRLGQRGGDLGRRIAVRTREINSETAPVRQKRIASYSTQSDFKDLGPKPGNEQQGRLGQAARAARARELSQAAKTKASTVTPKVTPPAPKPEKAPTMKGAITDTGSQAAQVKIPGGKGKGFNPEGVTPQRPDINRAATRILRDENYSPKIKTPVRAALASRLSGLGKVARGLGKVAGAAGFLTLPSQVKEYQEKMTPAEGKTQEMEVINSKGKKEKRNLGRFPNIITGKIPGGIES